MNVRSFVDGVRNFVNGLVDRRNPQYQNTIYTPKVGDDALRQVYRSGIGNKIVRIKINGALRETLQFSGKNDQQFYEMEIAHFVKDAAKFMLAFGRGIVVLHRRGENPETPWNPDRPGAIIVRVFSGDMVFAAGAAEMDFESPRYMMPRMYQVRGVRFHPSRVVDFTYVRPTEIELPRYNYGGVSEFELIYGQLVNDGIVERASVMTLEKNSVPTIKVKGLKTAMRTGQEGPMIEYFSRMEDAAHIAGARLIDDEDSIDLTTLTLTALSDADMIALRRLAMVTGIPLPQLVGESVRGMNSSGDTERQVFQEMLLDLQSDYLLKPINDLMKKFGRQRVWFKDNQGETAATRMVWETGAINNAKALYEMGEDHRAYLREKDILKTDDTSRFFGGDDTADSDEVDIDEIADQ